jgi:hypothetical protein
MINDASYEPDLAMISKVAFQQGITLLAMGINSGVKTFIHMNKLKYTDLY